MLSINCALQLIGSVNPSREKGDVKCELKILTHDKTCAYFSHKVFCFVGLFSIRGIFSLSPPHSRQEKTENRICNINEKKKVQVKVQ